MQSYIGELIQPVGWLEWNGTVGLDTIYYGEFQNYGPGSNTSRRVQWPGFNLMNATQAANFTVYNFTMGDTWLPYTDIPFSGGLSLIIYRDLNYCFRNFILSSQVDTSWIS
ncbi:hypothetical protein OIU77_013103 [Salix suchowensis]|uniref:Pectinesterase catalytic domain-containing protein n=1 Tax=Salix suchowensis TaxID=1278906 RepID=A0ABQ8ZSP4_9ROSI|nr:hypothetical protein OIU77_013103 [Salix suchowensis]